MRGMLASLAGYAVPVIASAANSAIGGADDRRGSGRNLIPGSNRAGLKRGRRRPAVAQGRQYPDLFRGLSRQCLSVDGVGGKGRAGAADECSRTGKNPAGGCDGPGGRTDPAGRAGQQSFPRRVPPGPDSHRRLPARAQHSIWRGRHPVARRFPHFSEGFRFHGGRDAKMAAGALRYGHFLCEQVVAGKAAARRFTAGTMCVRPVLSRRNKWCSSPTGGVTKWAPPI